MKEDEFYPLTSEGFPQYGVSKDARVVNFATGAERKQHGMCVDLYKDNIPHCFHVGKLAGKYHGEPIDLVPRGRKCNLGYLGYPRYTITSDGRLWNHETCRWQVLVPNQNGYIEVKLMDKDGVMRNHRFHRLVAMTFVPNPKKKPEVNHIDGNPLNNDFRNLEWVTGLENHKHAREHGLRKQRLTDDDVHQICKLIIAGKTDSEIAKMYETTSMMIWYIRHGGHPDVTSQYGFERRPQQRLTPIDHAKYSRRKVEKVKAKRMASHG